MEEENNHRIARDAQLIEFSLGEENFAIDIMDVQEIIPCENISKVPRAPLFVEGVINLRGKIIPVIDMRIQFGLEKKASLENKVVIINLDRRQIGFIVDSVANVIRIDRAKISPPPAIIMKDIEPGCIFGVVEQRNNLLIILNIRKVLSESQSQLLKKM